MPKNGPAPRHDPGPVCWHYYQNNRRRFLQRTATRKRPERLHHLGLARLFAEIDRQFQRLFRADILKPLRCPFTMTFCKGSMPDSYAQPLRLHRARSVEVYTSGEQAAAKPQDAFEIAATAQSLRQPANSWRGRSKARHRVAGAESHSSLPGLAQVPSERLDSSAFIDADLARLVFGNNVAFGEEKKARYPSALKALASQWADHELSALALHHWARAVQQDNDLVQAREFAQRGANAFPRSTGGRMCRNLIGEIAAKSVSIETERVWNAPWPRIEVRYRNLTNLHFRAVAYDWSVFLQKRRNRPENLGTQERKEVLAKAPTLAWSAKLPPTDDFKERAESLNPPDTSSQAFTFLLASPD